MIKKTFEKYLTGVLSRYIFKLHTEGVLVHLRLLPHVLYFSFSCLLKVMDDGHDSVSSSNFTNYQSHKDNNVHENQMTKFLYQEGEDFFWMGGLE
jgi:hypothetical protein